MEATSKGTEALTSNFKQQNTSGSAPAGSPHRLHDVLRTSQGNPVNFPSSEDLSPSTPSSLKAHTFSAFREMFFKLPVWVPKRQQCAAVTPGGK